LSELSRFRALTRELETQRITFGADAAARKKALLAELAALRFPRSRSASTWIKRLHEALLFLAAHPDNAAIAKGSLDALDRFTRDLSPALRGTLADTGIAATEVTYPFDFPIAAWLAARFPRNTRIRWKGFDDQEKLQSLLLVLTGPAEELAIDDEATSLEEWMQAAAGANFGAADREGSDGERQDSISGSSDLGWLVARLESRRHHPRLRDHLFDPVGVPVGWSIRDPRASRTLGRVSRSEYFHHTESLSRATPDLRHWIRRPIRGARLCKGNEARELADLAKAALSAREREMFPISHADERAVRVFPLERGLEIVTFGTLPERRLLLEGLWGFLFLKNGWPIGYGCFSAVFGSAEVAFNIFDTYRQGESALAYAQLLRVIHALTEATSFSAMKYQFGDDNAEAIKSGAFWFYDKLGFRHLDSTLRTLADGEREAKGKTRGYRTSPATLRKLATNNLYFHLGRETRNVLGELRFPEISLTITRATGWRPGADRESAIRAARARVKSITGTNVTAKGYSGEIAGEFAFFLNLFALEKWSGVERRAAGQLLKARAASDEAEFVTSLANHHRLKAETLKLLRRR
jgi:hypothetical protein